MSDPGPQDWISLTGLEFPCVVGLFESEQHTPQQLGVEIAMRLDLEGAAGGDLSRSVNYAAALRQIQFLAQNGRWLMLESMALAIMRHLLAPPAEDEGRVQVEAARVRLSKPEAFGGRAVPTIEVNRHRSWYRPEQRAVSEGVRAEVLQETKESGAYRIRLAPRTTWNVPPGLACMLISGRLLSGAAELGSGDTLGRGGAAVESVGPSCLLGIGLGTPGLAVSRSGG